MRRVEDLDRSIGKRPVVYNHDDTADATIILALPRHVFAILK